MLLSPVDVLSPPVSDEGARDSGSGDTGSSPPPVEVDGLGVLSGFGLALLLVIDVEEPDAPEFRRRRERKLLPARRRRRLPGMSVASILSIASVMAVLFASTASASSTSG